jgi:hypothetical protein
MTNVLTLAALAAVPALSVTSPVFAQAFALGARNDKVVTGGSAQGVLRNRQIVVSRNRQRKMAAPRGGLRAFAAVSEQCGSLPSA